MLVRDLAAALLERFPLEHAESWDRVGLSVGRPEDPVRGIACALDATVGAVERASELGANVLVTHHPIYLDPPRELAPAHRDRPSSGAAAYRAVELGVSVVSLHTDLDRDAHARSVLAGLAGIAPEGSLEHPDDHGVPGLGTVGPLLPGPLSLAELAERCAEAFSCEPRVWGDPSTRIGRAAVLGGSLGGFHAQAIAAGAEAVVCGEAGYHACLDALDRGCATVLVGHDRSEEPFVKFLQDEVGVLAPALPVATIVSPHRWWTLKRGDRS